MHKSTNKAKEKSILENLIPNKGNSIDFVKREISSENFQLCNQTIKSISEIVTITDLEDNFIYVNKAFCDIYGYTEEEVLGKHVKILSSPKNPPELLLEILRHSHDNNWKGELLNITKDGREFPISLRTSQIKNENDEIIGLVGISEDITERKKAEFKLKQSKEKYHSIFEATGTATLIVGEDTTIKLANKECFSLTGYRPEELIGTKWINYVSSESLEEMMKYHNLRRNVPGKAPKKYEVKLIDKKGVIRDAILDIEMIPGSRESVVSILDITERKLSEEKIKNAKLFLDSIINQSPNAMWISDENGTLIRLNRACCELMEISEKEVVGKYNILKDNVIKSQGLFPLIKKVFENGEAVNFELEYDSSLLKTVKLGKKEKTFLNITMFPIKDSSGKTTNAVIQNEDLSKTKKTEIELKKSELRLKEAQSRSHLGSWEFDSFVKPGYWSDEMFNLFRIDPQKGAPNFSKFIDLIHPEDKERINKIFRESVKKQKSSKDSYQIILPDGTIRWVEGHGVPEFDEKGKFVKLSGTTQDITERILFEQKLKEEKQQHSALISNLPGFAYRCINDKDWTMIYVSEGCKKITGYTSDELLNNSKVSFNALILPQYQKYLWKKWQKILKEKGKFEDEYEIKTASGEIRWVWERGNGIFNKSGKLLYLEGYIEDITERKKTDEALRQSEKNYRELFNGMNETVWVIDFEGNLIDVNDRAIEVLGYSKEELLSIGLYGIDSSLKRESIKFLASTMPKDKLQIFETIHTSKYGKSFPVEVYSSLITYHGKEAILSIARDITERKQAEKAIIKSEQKYKDIFTYAPAGIYQSTRDGKFITANARLAEILGYDTIKELMSLNLENDVYWDENEREKLIKMHSEFGGANNTELLWKKKDGSPIWISLSVHIMYREDKELYFEGFVIDISEQKKVEESLKESEEKYRNLIETMPEGFYRSTPEGYFIDVNPAFVKMLGYESKEELMKVYIPEELYFTLDERIDGVNYNIDFTPDSDIYRLKRKDGSEIWVNDHPRYVQDNSGKILYHEGILHDITESLRAQKTIIEAKEKAEEANKLKSSFLANMSHEIRTPLNGILGFADILKNELQDPSLIKYADIIEKSGNRLLETLNLILSFSKLEAEKEDVHYSNVRIEDVIEEVMVAFEIVAKNKNLEFNLNVKENELITYIDERFLRQIMNNLINNAIKFTESGSVTVDLFKEENNVVIKVKDTGIGIAKEKQKIIFEEFRQESEGHGRSFEGTGLGLAITRRFVELMKGTIEVESEVGVGTTFIVKFPYKKASQSITIKINEDSKKVKIDISPIPQQEQLSVLLVENDPMNLDYTNAILKNHFNVDNAVNAMEALELTKNKIYDIILMDINLGKGMDGIQTVKEIRKIDDYKKTPIIALTAFVLPGDRDEFIKGGCTHYLGKPFTKNQILDLLNKISESILV